MGETISLSGMVSIAFGTAGAVSAALDAALADLPPRARQRRLPERKDPFQALDGTLPFRSQKPKGHASSSNR